MEKKLCLYEMRLSLSTEAVLPLRNLGNRLVPHLIRGSHELGIILLIFVVLPFSSAEGPPPLVSNL